MASLAPFVTRRGAIYHLRVRIPLDLVAVVGRPEYKRSLKTSCPKVARRRAAKARGRLAEVFEEIRRMRDPREEQIQSLLDMVAEWEGIEDMRRRADAMRTETTGLQAAVAELKELERVGDEISRFSERWQPEIARLAADRNAAKESAPLFPALRECLSAFHRENDNAGSGGEAVELGLQLQSLATELQQAEDAVASKDAVIEEKDRQLGVQMGTLGAMLANLGIPNRNVHTETVTAYLHTHYLEKKKLRDDAKRHIVGYVTLFAKLTGDRPLAEYNAGEIVSYIRLLEQVKNTYGKSPKDKDLSVEGLLASSAGQKTLNVTSLNKHTGHVKAFLIDAAKHYRFATAQDIEDMFDGIDYSDFVPGAEKRKHWTVEQLNDLFKSSIWTGTGSGPGQFTKRHLSGRKVYRDSYWWLPVIALWTGARLEEIAQLHHEDLMMDKDGIPFVHIFDEGIRRVKTDSSIRDVPVHSALIRLGFLDLFKPSKRGERIFPELLPTGRLKKFGDTYSSHFTDYRRKCGLYERLRDYHSFRRTFITMIRTKAGVDPLTVAAMAGHDDEWPELVRVKQTNDYTDYSISVLKDAIERLDYEGLGLDVSPLLAR
jgi:integrase